MRFSNFGSGTLSLSMAVFGTTPVLADPLPSWNETEAKAAIIEFVETVTDPSSEDFVPQAARIATFDNDGCLWAEQPVYFQLLYAIDVLKEKAASDPSILTSDALKAGAEGDLEGILAGGMVTLSYSVQPSVNNDLEDVLKDFASSVTKFCRPKLGEVITEGFALGPIESTQISDLAEKSREHETPLKAHEVRKAAGAPRAPLCAWALSNEYLRPSKPSPRPRRCVSL